MTCLSAAASPPRCLDHFCSSHEFCSENQGGPRCLCRAIFASEYKPTGALGTVVEIFIFSKIKSDQLLKLSITMFFLQEGIWSAQSIQQCTEKSKVAEKTEIILYWLYHTAVEPKCGYTIHTQFRSTQNVSIRRRTDSDTTKIDKCVLRKKVGLNVLWHQGESSLHLIDFGLDRRSLIISVRAAPNGGKRGNIWGPSGRP